MNNDLISRSALLDALKTEEWAAILGNSIVRYLKAQTLIEKIPAVDAETVIKSLPYVKAVLEMAKQSLTPVVRCKDCKHSYKGSPHGLMCECPVGGQNTSLLGDNDFCSCGERRVAE